ncbi:hypothetical protein Ami103574_11690 [Aminipila butyrica]|uniref:Uncharacterized protein n=1 Tax=Aminipila butyrica TaxID=433296 RepID=A0A858BX04_9FIRM|nr:hypothetical protein [Aminipila butyrica]QIB69942.1 hypothetical protein Ami103574_11690 [Aminipila butyrica]
MKKNIIIFCLVLSNIISAVAFMNLNHKYSILENAESQTLYNIVGGNSNWILSDGFIQTNKNNLYISPGKLEYIGNLALDIKNLKLEIESNNETLFLTSFESNSGRNLIEDKEIYLGTFSSQKTNSEKIDNISNDKMIVKLEYVTKDNTQKNIEFKIKGNTVLE